MSLPPLCRRGFRELYSTGLILTIPWRFLYSNRIQYCLQYGIQSYRWPAGRIDGAG